MKRYISTDDKRGYTRMLEIISAIGGRNLKYNWLISNIEAYPYDNGIIDEKTDKLINEKVYVILSTNQLMDILEKNDFQWVWGIFSAIPEGFSDDEILKYDLPYIENEIFLDNNFVIQHPLADIEIVAEDSSSCFIVSKDDEIADKFKKLYPLSRMNY